MILVSHSFFALSFGNDIIISSLASFTTANRSGAISAPGPSELQAQLVTLFCIAATTRRIHLHVTGPFIDNTGIALSILTVWLNAHMTKDFHPGQGRRWRCMNSLEEYTLPRTSRQLRLQEPLKTLPATIVNKGEQGETEEIA